VDLQGLQSPLVALSKQSYPLNEARLSPEPQVHSMDHGDRVLGVVDRQFVNCRIAATTAGPPKEDRAMPEHPTKQVSASSESSLGGQADNRSTGKRYVLPQWRQRLPGSQVVRGSLLGSNDNSEKTHRSLFMHSLSRCSIRLRTNNPRRGLNRPTTAITVSLAHV
jgi:hypothetical protein